MMQQGLTQTECETECSRSPSCDRTVHQRTYATCFNPCDDNVTILTNSSVTCPSSSAGNSGCLYGCASAAKGPPLDVSMNPKPRNSPEGVLVRRTNCVLYSDLVVSEDGNDGDGDGTLTRPFRTLKKAAKWAHGEGDRILVMKGTYPSSMLQEVLMLPKKLTIYQDEPLRTDQAGMNGKPMVRLCKCHEGQANKIPGKELCPCEHGTSQPFFQQQNTAQQGQHHDGDEMAWGALDQGTGPVDFSMALHANDILTGRDGEVQLEIPEAMAHADYMGAVDSDGNDLAHSYDHL